MGEKKLEFEGGSVMSVSRTTPQYPPVNPVPSFGDCVSNLRGSDLVTLPVFGAVPAFIWSVAHNQPRTTRKMNIYTFGLSGLFVGLCVALRRVNYRLRGFSENQPEVR